jgi:hypothetical protein
MNRSQKYTGYTEEVNRGTGEVEGEAEDGEKDVREKMGVWTGKHLGMLQLAEDFKTDPTAFIWSP